MNIRVQTESYEASLNRHYAAVSARLRGQPKRVMLRVDTTEQAQVMTRTARREAARAEQVAFINECRALDMDPDQIILDFRERYPRVRASFIAGMLGMDESIIRGVLDPPIEKRLYNRVTAESAEAIHRMRAEGMSITKISEALGGIAESTIRYQLEKAKAA